MTDMQATALPGSMPGGTVRASPNVPCAASTSRLGVAAASRLVLPPRCGIGRPAAPSIINTQYFIFPDFAYARLRNCSFAPLRFCSMPATAR